MMTLNMEFLAFALLLLTLVITVAAGGLFFSVFLLVKRITQIPVDFRFPIAETPPVFSADNKTSSTTNDIYTPENADGTVPIESFYPSSKKKLKVIKEDEEDQITPEDTNAKKD